MSVRMSNYVQYYMKYSVFRASDQALINIFIHVCVLQPGFHIYTFQAAFFRTTHHTQLCRRPGLDSGHVYMHTHIQYMHPRNVRKHVNVVCVYTYMYICIHVYIYIKAQNTENSPTHTHTHKYIPPPLHHKTCY